MMSLEFQINKCYNKIAYLIKGMSNTLFPDHLNISIIVSSVVQQLNRSQVFTEVKYEIDLYVKLWMDVDGSTDLDDR